MPASEFTLIKRYFQKTTDDALVQCAIGDDAAIVRIPDKMELAISTDTLLQNVHFSAQTNPADIAYKALAVNISDMVAMAAQPKWVLLSISLPDNDEEWIRQFASSFLEQTKQHKISLIGGDLSRGPLSITVQIHGLLPEGTALKRSGAKPNDLIYVTGTLGDAGVGLDILKQKITVATQHRPWFLACLNRPKINIEAGIRLRTIANSAIDISDGLLADLQHILDASQLGAEITMEQLPLSLAMCKTVAKTTAWNYALTAGDDYQLCFTATQNKQQQIITIFKQLDIPVCQIGKTTMMQGLRCKKADSTDFIPAGHAYTHF